MPPRYRRARRPPGPRGAVDKPPPRPCATTSLPRRSCPAENLPRRRHASRSPSEHSVEGACGSSAAGKKRLLTRQSRAPPRPVAPKHTSYVPVALRRAPRCRRATPSFPRRRRPSLVAAPCRRLASPFAVLDRVPLHRRCAGPSTLQRPETVAGTPRDATTSATMPVVAGELHVASDAVVDPRRAPNSVSRRPA